MREKHSVPERELIEAMEPFERLGLEQIRWVASAEQAELAWQELQGQRALGFDTESKPTFVRHEVSDGPHILQLATPSTAYIFSLSEPGCRPCVARLLGAANILKVGFGLGDDRKRIVTKLGIEPQGIVDLNHVFHQQGWRKDMGVKGAVAVMYQKRFIKSKKAATSNWAARQLSSAQLIYAANDAWAALRVYQALGLE
ncbi:MAG: 3'-5' exonuclease [Betaproteobacteria bacterium]